MRELYIYIKYFTIHDDIDPQYLHGVQRVRYTHQRGQRHQHQGRYGRGELEPDEVADVVKDALAFLDC